MFLMLIKVIKVFFDNDTLTLNAIFNFSKKKRNFENFILCI